jgi:hypothetical protein
MGWMQSVFEELAVLEASIAFVGFFITLSHFRGAVRYLSIALISDALSNVAYLLFPHEAIFMMNSFVVCAMIACFFRHIVRYKRVL